MRHIRLMHNVILPAAAFFCMLAFILLPAAKAQDKVELFGGFSYVRGNVAFQQVPPVTPCGVICPLFAQPGSSATVTQHPNLFGWEFSAAYKFFPFISANLDFGEQYGSLNGGSDRLKTYLFGPQLSLPGPISPFVHAEFGFAHESVGTFSNAMLVSPGSDTSFATALGGGLDIKALPFFSIRVIQIDDLRTSLYHGTQNRPRVSAGIVFRF